MQSFRKILVGVDLSHGDRLVTSDLGPPTREAIRRAVWLAGQVPAELTFLSALEVSPQTEDALKNRSARGERTVVDDAREVLDGLAEQARQDGAANVRTQVVFGRPWVEIIREVLQEECDLVIAGTRNPGIASRLLFGGTGLKLLRNCPCPVWVTKPDPNWEDLNILVASDFSETSQDALNIAVLGGQLSGAKLHVLHAVEHDFERQMSHAGLDPAELEAHREKTRAEAEHQLHRQLAQTDYRTLPYGVRVHVKEGPADLVILGAIEEFGVDLLVMGSAGRTGLAGMLFGNTAERLLPHVPCSVLIVKPRDFQCPVSLE